MNQLRLSRKMKEGDTLNRTPRKTPTTVKRQERTLPKDGTYSPADIAHLQRTIGNHATRQVLSRQNNTIQRTVPSKYVDKNNEKDNDKKDKLDNKLNQGSIEHDEYKALQQELNEAMAADNKKAVTKDILILQRSIGDQATIARAPSWSRQKKQEMREAFRTKLEKSGGLSKVTREQVLEVLRSTRGRGIPPGSNLSGIDLSNARLMNAKMKSVILASADLTGARMYRADLYRANFISAIMQRAKMEEADLRFATMYGADLFNADLTGANLYEAQMQDTDLLFANLTDASMSRADLTRADLSYAKLNGADLRGAKLTDAKFNNANMEGAVLSSTYEKKLGLSDEQERQILWA